MGSLCAGEQNSGETTKGDVKAKNYFGPVSAQSLLYRQHVARKFSSYEPQACHQAKYDDGELMRLCLVLFRRVFVLTKSGA